MSTDTNRTSSTDVSDTDLRARYDAVVVSKTRRARVLHVPDEESEEASPLCGTADIDRGWKKKSVVCYPPGHRDWCRRCAELVPDRVPPTGTPQWIIEGEVVAGNAMAKEW